MVVYAKCGNGKCADCFGSLYKRIHGGGYPKWHPQHRQGADGGRQVLGVFIPEYHAACHSAPIVKSGDATLDQPNLEFVEEHQHCNGYWRSGRSEEHTSELQSLMRISYAVLCLKQKHNIT